MLRVPQKPRARRRDFEDNRRRILEAARLILSERGPESLTVSMVAHRAGLNRTTAYQHFRTRDALAAAVMAETADELTGMLREPQHIWGDLDRMVPFFADHPELARLTLHQLLSESPLPESGWRTYLAWIRKLVAGRNARPGIDAEMLSYVLMCVGILWPLLARAQYEDAASARRATGRLTRELRRLLQHGVMRPEAGSSPVASIDARKSGERRRAPKERKPPWRTPPST
jgi:AcrR family transcriptional regulator